MISIILSTQTIIGTLLFLVFLFYDVIFTIKFIIWLRSKCNDVKECLTKFKKFIHWKS